MVEHTRARRTYEERFYTVRTEKAKKRPGMIYGWPFSVTGAWCNSAVKMPPLKAVERGGNIVYIGIASDETNRFHNLNEKKKSPLVEAGWDEAYCRQWSEENDLLSPIYTTATRGGCWFCHNQGVNQLRLLRKNYPELWSLMLKWDSDSPVTFHADGHTVRDFDERFALEDAGIVSPDNPWKWEYLRSVQLRWR